MNTNPFYPVAYFPAFDAMTPETFREAFPLLLNDATKAVDALEQHATPTWDTFVRPLYEASHPLLDAWGTLSHLVNTCASDAWRALQTEFQPELVAYILRVGQSPVFYSTLCAIRDRDAKEHNLTDTQRLILSKSILDAEQSGVGLPPEQQVRFNAIQTELAKLSSDFSNHVLDATKAFSLTLTTPEDVAGMPDSLLAVTAAAAGGDPKTGPWKITLDNAVLGPFLKYSRNRPAREKLYRAKATRATQGDTDNTALVERLLALRQEMATMLGFATYAELSLSRKTAPSVAAVDALTQTLEAAAKPIAHAEAATLLAFAKEHGFTEEKLQAWDVPFYVERQREALYDYSDDELSRYFDFPHVLQGLFDLSARLFDISITEHSGEVPVWHPDVRFYRVTDKTGNPLASFYLDPYSRPETKSGGAWMHDVRTRDLRLDGTCQLPIAIIVCNQSVPVNGHSLMRFYDVSTLFHEFGHALQLMLTTVDEPEASGLNGIDWDAVEVASQFMENWCYDRATLHALSRHVDTGEPLPEAFYKKIIAAKNYRSATAMTGQLTYGAVDMELYARYPAPQYTCANDVMRAMNERFGAMVLLPEERFLNTFTHIFCGGYSAGYYGYKWSEVMSADVFGAFEEAGLDNADAIHATGIRYRDTFLALGGSVDPMAVFQRFRDRAPSVAAILRHAGLNT